MEMNLYLQIFNYSKQKLDQNQGVKLDDLKTFLFKAGFARINDQGSNEARMLQFCMNNFFYKYGRSESNERYYLNPDAFFGMIGYYNYQHSMEAAKRAEKIALASILFTAVLALTSIITSIFF